VRRSLLRALVVSVGLIGTAFAATGYRNDGTGVWPGTNAPTAWSLTERLIWRTALPAWSNASPAVGAGKVCVCSEPTTLICADATTGRVVWSAPHDVLATLGGDEKAKATALVTAGDAAEAELATLRTEVSRLSREARANPSADASARLKAVQDRMGTLKTAVAAAAHYRTPPNQGLIGWSSPSPAIDPGGVWALFGNGVVAGHGLDGSLKWSRWLGPPPERMLGYDSGTSASPLRVDDLLVVPFGNLTALDAATGAVRWTDKRPWPHYGPPTATKVGGVSMLLLPDGRILRARDGVELAKDLANVWYIAPVLAGDVALYLEARSGAEVIQNSGVTMKAYRLSAAPGGSVTAMPLWTTKIPAKDPFYGQPVASLGYVYMATSTAELWTINLATGAVSATRKLDGLANDTVYAGPMVAGGHLYVGNDSGQTAVLSIGATPELLRVNTLEAMRASPAFLDGRVYLRSANALYAFQ
jgi:outer membrane protein assembly factor BamB